MLPAGSGARAAAGGRPPLGRRAGQPAPSLQQEPGVAPIPGLVCGFRPAPRRRAAPASRLSFIGRAPQDLPQSSAASATRRSRPFASSRIRSPSSTCFTAPVVTAPSCSMRSFLPPAFHCSTKSSRHFASSRSRRVSRTTRSRSGWPGSSAPSICSHEAAAVERRSPRAARRRAAPRPAAARRAAARLKATSVVAGEPGRRLRDVDPLARFAGARRLPLPAWRAARRERLRQLARRHWPERRGDPLRAATGSSAAARPPLAGGRSTQACVTAAARRRPRAAGRRRAARSITKAERTRAPQSLSPTPSGPRRECILTHVVRAFTAKSPARQQKKPRGRASCRRRRRATVRRAVAGDPRRLASPPSEAPAPAPAATMRRHLRIVGRVRLISP